MFYIFERTGGKFVYIQLKSSKEKEGPFFFKFALKESQCFYFRFQIYGLQKWYVRFLEQRLRELRDVGTFTRGHRVRRTELARVEPRSTRSRGSRTRRSSSATGSRNWWCERVAGTEGGREMKGGGR